MLVGITHSYVVNSIRLGISMMADGRNYYDDLPSSSRWVCDNFVVGDLIGQGSFGRVYTVESRNDRKVYALKEISSASQPRHVASELRLMMKLGGRNNILGIHAAYREKERIFFVMDFFPHDTFKDILPLMTSRERVLYMKNLFISLEYLHSHNIIHRDVKPGNFLYNRKQKRFALVDFGLSHEYQSKENTSGNTCGRQVRADPTIGSSTDSSSYVPETCCDFEEICEDCLNKPRKHVNKGGTPGYRSPEVLLRFDQHYQTTAIDIWSAGVLLLGLLCKRHPVFRPADDFEALTHICALLGSKSVVETAKEHNVRFLIKSYPGVDLVKLAKCVRIGIDQSFDGPGDRCEPCSRLVYANTKGRCFCVSGQPASLSALNSKDRLCFELLMHCLIANPSDRYTARQLLNMIEENRSN